MTDHLEINRRNWDERTAIHARDSTGDYMLDRFRAGEDALHEIEAAELGDISGKRVLHLQCHIGRDTLCLVRRGATVTGLDFSGAALDVARRLSDETGLKANFVEGTVDQAPDLTPGPFDLVFTTWGTICWLPDMKKWAMVDCLRAGAGRGALFRGRPSGLQRAGGSRRKSGAEPRFSNARRPAAAVRRRDHLHRRSDHPVASVDTGVDPLALVSARWAHRCRTYHHDVQGTRSVALARPDNPGACVGKDVAAAGWHAPHSLVLFREGTKRPLKNWDARVMQVTSGAGSRCQSPSHEFTGSLSQRRVPWPRMHSLPSQSKSL